MKFFTILFLVGVACAVGSRVPSETAMDSSPRKEETTVRDSARTSTMARDSTTIAPDTTRGNSSYNIVKIVKNYIEHVIRYLEDLVKPNWRNMQERQQRP